MLIAYQLGSLEKIVVLYGEVGVGHMREAKTIRLLEEVAWQRLVENGTVFNNVYSSARSQISHRPGQLYMRWYQQKQVLVLDIRHSILGPLPSTVKVSFVAKRALKQIRG